MRLIIAGSRDLKIIGRKIHVYIIRFGLNDIQEVVCGCSGNVDIAGKIWGQYHGIEIKPFEPEWGKHGKPAGPIRNALMADYGDELLLIWDGKSRGSANMKKVMEYAGKPVYEVIL